MKKIHFSNSNVIGITLVQVKSQIQAQKPNLPKLKTTFLFFELYNTKHKQFYFNCAYFLGFSGALQGIITVDLTGIYTFYDMLTLHLQHSLIILNLLWLIFAYNFKFIQKGIIQSFLFTN